MKHKRLNILALLLIVVMLFPFGVNASGGEVYVIPITGEITNATTGFVRDSIRRAEDGGASAIVFDINTYGGQIAAAEDIKNYIIDTDVDTVSYVNNKAESAGVLITIAADKVMMSKSSTIGSAETIPNEEKVLSMWRAMLRDTAQYRGRPDEIVEAMADVDVVVEGLSEKGKLLNLTSAEATELGVSDVVAKDIESGLKDLGIEFSSVVRVEETFSNKIAKLVSSQLVSSILLSLAFVAFIVELFIPGFGIPGIISVASFILFFAGNYMAGYSSWVSILLFIAGIVMMFIELMVPGFGLPGISGIILLFSGIVTAMNSLESAVQAISIAFVASAVTIVILVKLGKKTKIFERLSLQKSSSTHRGYVSNDAGGYQIGDEGITLTDLRPSGFMVIDGEKLDALAESSYIVRDTKVVISKIEGSKIFVKEIV